MDNKGLHLFNNQPLSTQCKVCGQILLPHNLFLVTPLHDLWALIHSQPHLDSLLHKSLYHIHPLSDLSSRIQRSHSPYPFLESAKIPKCSFTHAYYTSTDAHQNSELNKIKSHGFCHTCKPDQLVLGANMSWHKFSKRCYGTTWLMNYCKKSRDDSATPINEQLCL